MSGSEITYITGSTGVTTTTGSIGSNIGVYKLAVAYDSPDTTSMGVSLIGSAVATGSVIAACSMILVEGIITGSRTSRISSVGSTDASVTIGAKSIGDTSKGYVSITGEGSTVGYASLQTSGEVSDSVTGAGDASTGVTSLVQSSAGVSDSVTGAGDASTGVTSLVHSSAGVSGSGDASAGVDSILQSSEGVSGSVSGAGDESAGVNSSLQSSGISGSGHSSGISGSGLSSGIVQSSGVSGFG